MNWPDIEIVMTTWFPPDERGPKRLEIAKQALTTWVDRLIYQGEVILHIADDGSGIERQLEVLLATWLGEGHITRQSRRGVGASLNAGMGCAFAGGRLVLYLVDDWSLTQPFDITPWATLLEHDDSIGMVRLGLAHPDLTGKVCHDPESGQYFLRLDRHHYAFGFRPALFHRRMSGPFAEEVSSNEAERLYAERYGRGTGPDIALALLHPWEHLYGVELSAVEPS